MVPTSGHGELRSPYKSSWFQYYSKSQSTVRHLTLVKSSKRSEKPCEP